MVFRVVSTNAVAMEQLTKFKMNDKHDDVVVLLTVAYGSMFRKINAK
jgi:hypothetical protein